MKIIRHLLLTASVLTGFLLSSCSKAAMLDAGVPDGTVGGTGAQEGPDSCLVVFSFADAAATKVSGSPELLSEDSYGRVYYILRDANGTFVRNGLINPCVSSFTLYLNASTTYTIQMALNYDISYITSSFINTSNGKSASWYNNSNALYDLSSVSTNRLPMRGEKQFTTGSSGSTSVVVPMSRLVSRVTVGSISVNMSAGFLGGGALRVNRIYLTNVPKVGRMSNGNYYNSYTYTVRNKWYNTMGYHTNNDVSQGYDAMVVENNVNVDIYPGGTANVPCYFYTVANQSSSTTTSSTWSVRCTRLVIETTIAGVTYYYVSNIPSMTAGTSYNFSSITINNVGSLDPEGVTPGALTLTFSTSTDGWDDTFDVQETI